MINILYWDKNNLIVDNIDDFPSDKDWILNIKSNLDKKCDKCWIDILTTHLNNKKVYCEECYNKEVY